LSTLYGATERALATFELERNASTLGDETNSVTADVVSRPLVVGTGISEPDNDERTRYSLAGIFP
jgi:hypothetical protein